jgi:hypothetical protein
VARNVFTPKKDNMVDMSGYARCPAAGIFPGKFPPASGERDLPVTPSIPKFRRSAALVLRQFLSPAVDIGTVYATAICATFCGFVGIFWRRLADT